jgi:hypothetical protein
MADGIVIQRAELVHTAAWITLIAAAVYGLHRLAVWAESRGWIYYRTHKAPPGAAGAAMMHLAAFVEPEVEHVLDEIHAQQVMADPDESGEPALPG